MDLKNKEILLTGGAGFLGSYVEDKLLKRGVKPENIFIPRSLPHDLREKDVCRAVTEGKDIVIHLAGNVGGIGYNRKYPGTLLYDNLMMGIQLMDAARQSNVEKFIAIGTVCAYPKFTEVPFLEENLWSGYPEETNAPYGLAKLMLLEQARAYRRQYGFNAIYLLPVNLYGPRDNFDEDTSHVIPALIKKVANAKKEEKEYIEAWGDGSASREFLFVEDAAEAIVLATERYDQPDPINLGSGMEISIKDLVTLICKLMEYEGEIRWDPSKPNGQPRRCLDTSKAEKEFEFKAATNFRTGLKKTIEWYSD